MEQEDRVTCQEDLVDYIPLLFGPVRSLLGPICHEGPGESLYGIMGLIEIVEKRMEKLAELIQAKVGEIQVEYERCYRPLAAEILGIQISGEKALGGKGMSENLKESQEPKERLRDYVNLIFAPITELTGRLVMDSDDADMLYGLKALIEVAQKRLIEVGDLLETKEGKLEVFWEDGLTALSGRVSQVEIKEAGRE